jgi:hypothetical protein
MSTCYTTILIVEDLKRIVVSILRIEHLDPYRELQQSKEYRNIMSFLKKEVLLLKEKGLEAS